MKELLINKNNQVGSPENVIFFKADINYTVVYYENGKTKVIVKTLKYIEQELKHHGFYRIHKSFLVNLKYINERPTGFSLELQNEFKLSIARRKMPGLRRQLKSKYQNNRNHEKNII